MSGERINISLSSKALIATALGAGLLAGAGTVYLLSRNNNNQANIQQIITQIHAAVQGVRQDVANLEHEIGLLRTPTDFLSKENRSYSKGNGKKSVSFDSRSVSSSKYQTDPTSSEWSYKTAQDAMSDSSSWRTAPAYETDYFSPDEEEEFYDVYTSDDESRSLHTRDDGAGFVKEASELSWLLREFDQLAEGDPSQQKAAYELIYEKGDSFPNNAEVLWRKAKSMRNMAMMEEDQNSEAFKNCILEGYELARQALEINDSNAEVHKWFAILCGIKGQFSSTKERISGGHIFKKHIDLALQICPNDAALHHLLGRFCYEISQLSWIEKQVASTLFGQVPNGSYEEALDHFLAAEDLKTKDWKENLLFIALCYLRLRKLEDGTYWLRKAFELPSLTSEDERIHSEVEKLMDIYSMTS